MDEDLRRRLQGLDPMPARVPVDPAGSTRARNLLEEVVTEQTRTYPAAGEERDAMSGGGLHARRRVLFAGALAAAAVAAVAVVVLAARDDDQATSRQSLAIAEAGPTMSSCLPFDVSVLADMPMAFGGTVVAISDTAVTIDVDRWYRAPSGETELVDVTLPAENTSAALDGVDFASGERFLVTATNGIVNVCGFSGPATPELEAAFEAAFGT